jgi:hypothetical protein
MSAASQRGDAAPARVTDVIVQRLLPTYDLLIVTTAAPDIVSLIFAASIGLRPDTSNDAQRVKGLSRPWSFVPRTTVWVAPSVGGSNVHVRMALPWWTILILAMLGLAWLPSVRARFELTVGLVAGAATIIAWITSGFQEQRESLVDVLAGHVASSSPRSLWRAFAVAVSFVLLLVGASLYQRYEQQQRDVQIARAAFAIGSSRQIVLATLGNPDVELVHTELPLMGTLPPCAIRATTQLSYIGSAASCTVYLDHHGRVVCVLHGPGARSIP